MNEKQNQDQKWKLQIDSKHLFSTSHEKKKNGENKKVYKQNIIII